MLSTNDSPSTSSYDHNREILSRPTDAAYQWTSERHTHEVADFDNFESGFHLEPSQAETELDVFQYFVDNDFVSMIVNMTNKFHTHFVLNVDIRMHSRLQAWHDVTIPEMYIFFSIM